MTRRSPPAPDVRLVPDTADGLSYDIVLNAVRRLAATLTSEQKDIVAALGSAGSPERSAAAHAIFFGVLACDAPGSVGRDDALVLANFRYALGRQTGVVDEVASLLVARWSRISGATRTTIRSEIAAALDAGTAGMEMDAREWRRVLDTVDGGGDSL